MRQVLRRRPVKRKPSTLQNRRASAKDQRNIRALATGIEAETSRTRGYFRRLDRGGNGRRRFLRPQDRRRPRHAEPGLQRSAGCRVQRLLAKMVFLLVRKDKL
jgi:hypothetical protein